MGRSRSSRGLVRTSPAEAACHFGVDSLETAIHWLVITVHRDWKEKSGLRQTNWSRSCPKSSSVQGHLSDPENPVGQRRYRPNQSQGTGLGICDPLPSRRGEILFQKETISPLVAFYHSAEKMAGHGTKAIYVCLPPDEWGDKLPVRSSFKHIYPKELQKSVVRKWQEYGFSS